MNWIYEAIQDSIFSSLEEGHVLPSEFELTIEDVAFRHLIKSLKVIDTGLPVDPKSKRVSLRIQDHKVLVRSDLDPEPSLPASWEDSLH